MNRNIFFALAFILLMPMAFADTPITVKSYPDREINLNVLNPDTGDALASFVNMTDSAGEYKVVYTGSGSKIAFSVISRNNGKIETDKKFGNYSTGNPITLDLLVSQTGIPVSSSNSSSIQNSSNSSAQVQQNNTTGSGSTSAVINSNSSSDSKEDKEKSPRKSFSFDFKPILSKIYYAVAVIAVLVLVYFAVKILKQKGFFSPGAEGKSWKGYDPRIEKELAEAQRKIREAQEEIERIKNRKSRVIEAQKRFEEAKKELEKLQKD